MNTKLKKALVIGGLASAACSLVASITISSVSYYKSLQSEKVVEEQKEKIVSLEKDLSQKEHKIKEICKTLNDDIDYDRHESNVLHGYYTINTSLVPDNLNGCQE